MIQNDLEILQSHVNDYSNAAHRAGFETAARAAHAQGSEAIARIQKQWHELAKKNDQLIEKITVGESPDVG